MSTEQIIPEDYADDKQKTAGGNYPWEVESALEKETNKELDPTANPKVNTTIAEVLSKVNRGPIYLENEKQHPFFKPTLKTMYAKRANQFMIEADVIIPFHLTDGIAEEVISKMKAQKYTFEIPISVIYEQMDRTGSLQNIKNGVVKEYRFVEIAANSGSISASIQGTIDWND